MEKYGKLKDFLRPSGRLAVAFSGGADSTLLLCAAIDALGAENVLAITLTSPLMPAEEGGAALALAVSLGVEHLFVAQETIPPEVRANPRDRCYHCKRALFSRLVAAAAGHGFAAAAEGSNLDDLGQYRPGLRAVRELGVLSPLAEIGFTKAEVRETLRKLGVSVHAKPSAPCLATRIPYGTALTKARLRAVESGERLLHEAGFPACRLRHHGDTARIEVPKADFPRLLESGLESALHGLGFTYIALDMDGLRSGSMDEAPAKAF